MYTLHRLHVSRLVRSRHDDHNLLRYQHGSLQRLCKPYLSIQSFSRHHLIRRSSSNVVQAARATTTHDNAQVVSHEDAQNVFDSLRNLDVIDAKSDTRAEASDQSYENLWMWKEPLDVPKSARDLFHEFWRTPEQARVTDLSYWDVLRGEVEDKYPTATISQKNAYRAVSKGNPDRCLTLLFISEYYDLVTTSQGLPDDAATALLSVLELDGRSEAYERIGHLYEFSWVLLAEPKHIVSRYLALAKFREKAYLKPLPLWLLLQILRAPSLDRNSIMQLTKWVMPRVESWNWYGNSAMIMGLRLLRHARRAAAPDFEAITACFISALKLRFRAELFSEIPLLTLWCNRFLSLLALPASGSPFQAAKSQQAAQLDLLQFMQDYWLEIDLGREGYRALARVQLMHAKTGPEREWAHAKALTWPPWEERNRMGAFLAPARYEGQETRVLKVLNRMVESGYAPHKFEASMKILTGWDTDKSPTIQLTRVPPRIPQPWKAGTELRFTASDPLIWSSRVDATRTVREAWMVFCSYTSTTPAEKQSQYVYYSMHKKLVAPEAPLSRTSLLPGDGPEVFQDPELMRDRVYIPQEIPTPQELVSKMLENDIACGDRVLAYLLECETRLESGLELLDRSHLNPETRAVLSRPQSLSVRAVASAIERLPLWLRSAYVKLLTRPNTLKSQKVPVSYVRGTLDGPHFVQKYLSQSSKAEVAVWNAYLTGLTLHVDDSSTDLRRMHLVNALGPISDALVQILQRTQPNFNTLRIVYPSAQAHNISVERIQELFIAACCGQSTDLPSTWWEFCQRRIRNFHAFPSGDDIASMVWVLGSESSTKSGAISALLRWVHLHKSQLLEAGVRLSKHNLAAFRLFLEQEWVHQAFEERAHLQGLSATRTSKAHDLLIGIADGVVYPDDEYMLKYLHLTAHTRHRLELKIQRAKADRRIGVRLADRPGW